MDSSEVREIILFGPFVVGIRLRLEAIKLSALILLFGSVFSEIGLDGFVEEVDEAELRRFARISVISERFKTESVRESIERAGFFEAGSWEAEKV